MGEYVGIELIIKIAGIGILSSVVGQILKHMGKEDIATFTNLASIIIVLIMIITSVSNLFEQVKSVFSLFIGII